MDSHDAWVRAQMRTARVKRAKTAHSERLLRFRKNYKVDIPKTVRLGERNRLVRCHSDAVYVRCAHA